MSAQEQITRLQGLLARIQRNSAKARGSAPSAAPVVAARAPMGYAAPPAAPSAADQSVDDLLEASPMPVDVDVPLDTIPPVAPVAAAPSEAPEADPIPLVSVAAATPVAPAPPPAPVDDSFSLESEVSEVRVASGTREAVEVTVAAIEAEAEPIGTEELSEDDLVEVTDATSVPPPAADVDIDFEDEDEQPPASSQRKVASSMDEALAAAAEQLDADREVPIKTPPPESGPQEAPTAASFAAPPAPDVDSLLGQELDIPTRESAGVVPIAAGPTTEQLGQTIDLDEARGPSLELAEAPVVEVSAVSVEELEVALPAREVVGGYDDNLQPPPEALDELDAHRRRFDDELSAPPESLAQLPSVQPSAVDIVPPVEAPAYQAPSYDAPPAYQAPSYDAPPAYQAPSYDAPPPVAEAAPVAPEVTTRTLPVGSPETFASVREPFRPSSFSELLDASLALNGD
jgi:hypothetical protein